MLSKLWGSFLGISSSTWVGAGEFLFIVTLLNIIMTHRTLIGEILLPSKAGTLAFDGDNRVRLEGKTEELTGILSCLSRKGF